MTASFGGEATIFSLVTEQAGTARSAGNTRVAEQLGQGPSRALPAPRSLTAPHHTMPRKSWSPRDAETGLQAHRRDKFQPETAGPTNTRGNHMVKGKLRNVTQKSMQHATLQTQFSHNSKS